MALTPRTIAMNDRILCSSIASTSASSIEEWRITLGMRTFQGAALSSAWIYTLGPVLGAVLGGKLYKDYFSAPLKTKKDAA